MQGIKLVPLTGINLDLARQYMPPNKARYIKNLYYMIQDAGDAGSANGVSGGVMKPLPSFEEYVTVELPEGENIPIGARTFRETTDLYVFVWNSKNNHCIYRVNGETRQYEMVKIDPLFNFQLQPEYSIGEFQCWLEVLHIVDPDTGDEVIKHDLYWTDGYNPQGYLRVEDCIASNGFDENLYPYFSGDYDRGIFIRMGIPTPKNCIKITEVTPTPEDREKINRLLYKSLQLRISITDVYGRPSEHSIISDLYIPGINDCIASSNSLARCIDAEFLVDNPLWDTVNIEYSINNSPQWYRADTLFLYKGSTVGDWWLRDRNDELNWDGNKITYRFCLDVENIPISGTGRLENPLPKSSQSLYKYNDVIGLSNNRDGFIPVSIDEKNKIKITVEKPEAGAGEVELRNITIYAAIFNPERNDSVWQSVRKEGDSYIWGNNNSNAPARNYDQYFANPAQSGFLGYLVGGNSVVSTQVYLDADGNLVDDPEHLGMNASPTHFTLQKFVFTNVPKGTYVFRLASTLFDTSAGGDYEKTSTTIWGLCPYTRASSGVFSIRTNDRMNSQEVVVDVCEKDYDTLSDNKILVIADLAYHHGGLGENNSKVTTGYIYATRKNGYNERPVELMQVNPERRSHFTTIATDHNGFYWVEATQRGRTFNIHFKNKCIDAHVNVELPRGDRTGIFHTNVYIDEYGLSQFADYPDTPCNQILITGRITLGEIGVPNVPVVLTRGATSITDDDGNFSIVAHDDVVAGVRKDSLIVANGACNYTNVDGGCIEPKPITINPCSTCVERNVVVNDISVAYLSQRGLLSGGRYAIGFNRFDWLGRISAIQDIEYISIPTVIETKALSPSKVRIEFPSDFRLPSDTDYITIGITKELTIQSYITWIVDKVVFIDNTGGENTVSPTQIKIYYQSIVEYNKQNNFNTTAQWQFMEALPDSTNTPYTNDLVQFFINGDGSYFDKLTTSLVKYDKDGQYFLIDYTNDLANLQQNALIRLFRPKQNTSETEPYYETCMVIPVENGIPKVTDFYLNAFDTYYLNRQIPVPVNAAPSGSTTTSQTQTQVTNPDGSVTTTTTTSDDTLGTVNELRIFGFQFEHDSPSNFWGKGVQNIGRANIKNPYEDEIIHLNQVALSGALSVNSRLSYLQYFDAAQKTDFQIQSSGGITALVYQQGFVFGICQYGNFIAGFNDNLLRQNSDGSISVPSARNSFGQPERKRGFNYGCLIEDKLTIALKDNNSPLIMFLDTKNAALIESNFSNAIPVSEPNVDYAELNSTVKSWIVPKIKYIKAWNKANPNNKKYWHGSINPSNGEYLLTDIEYHIEDFVNNERNEDITVSETMAWDTMAKVWKGSYSFIPYLYGYINGEMLGQNQLFAFKGAQPYHLYDLYNFNRPQNTFFGIKCNRVFRFVFCPDGAMKQFFKCIEVYCPQSAYFSDIIVTEASQQSRLMLSQMRKGSYFWQASFMCDSNSYGDAAKYNGLFEGTSLYGTWIDVRLVGDPAKDDLYSEFYGVTCFFVPLMKSGAITT